MGYKITSDVTAYIDTITPQELKEAFEKFGFVVELKEEVKKGASDE